MWTNLKPVSDASVVVSLDPFTSPFAGATLSLPGIAGIVPAPPAGSQDLPLLGNGQFGTIAASRVTGLAPSAVTDTTNADNIASGTVALARLPALGFLSPSVANQTITGGANVTPLQLTPSSGAITINCGVRSLQWVQNNGAMAINAPAADGSCLLDIINTSIAGAVTWVGFTAGPSTGDPITTANGAIFRVAISRIAGISTYIVKALQ
jgi:hypothetical protein